MRWAMGGVSALLLTLAVLAWLIRRQLAVITVFGESMRPTYHSGDRVLVRRARPSQLRAGQVVVIERPADAGAWATPLPRWPGRSGRWMIKRIAALPGDRLADLPLPSARPEPPADAVVPPGQIVVLGDNQADSFDSRQFGYCPADRLLGIVLRPISPAAQG